ncbi:MAG: hypothetical protein NT018_06580, partial [Armatimonadetes bacterium]|nr:hypothetical protein [Armatimonadota bacterium]
MAFYEGEEMIDHDRLQSAFDTALAHLLGQMRPEGYWEGHLSSSALSTATAISALSVAGIDGDVEIIKRGMNWLGDTQCADGGWGDTPDSPSNLSTTLLCASALKLAKNIAIDEEIERKADGYITAHAGASASDRCAAIGKIYGADRTFAVPILMNCAMAGIVSWADVPPLPFELAIFPRNWYKALRLQVVSYALPALIAVGLNIHRHNPTRNLLIRALRSAVAKRAIAKLATLQPSSGGFLEATPLTCFVAMSLISTLGAKQPVAAKCLDFARKSQRADGSWPIDTNLSAWVTSCAVSALASSNSLDKIDVSRTAKWIADRQYQDTHPYTGAAPRGWGWTHLAGGVPDADDTSGAILALKALACAHSKTPSCAHPSILSSVEGCGQISPRASTELSMLES